MLKSLAFLLLVVASTSSESSYFLESDSNAGFNSETLRYQVPYLVRSYSFGAGEVVKNLIIQISDYNKEFNVILLNKKGDQNFIFGIINDSTEFGIDKLDATINSKKNSQFTNPIVKISSDYLRKASCTRKCKAMISIYSSEKQGNEIQFTIQTISNANILLQNTVLQQKFSKGSYKFYEYRNINAKSLLIKANSFDKNCRNIYFSHKQFPSSTNYLAMENADQLIYNNPKQGVHYIGIEAFDDCEFRLSVSQLNTTITTIQLNQFYDIQLDIAQKQMFLLRRISNLPFKLVSQHNYGNIKIYANQTELTAKIVEQFSDNTLKFQNFMFKGQRNALTFSRQKGHLCEYCTYLIIVQAIEKTQCSIVAVGENSKVHLSHNKILFDEIEKKGGSTNFVMNSQVLSGELIVHVYQGNLKIQISSNDQLIQKEFSGQGIQTYNYNFAQDSLYFDSLQVKIRGLNGSSKYSMIISPIFSKQYEKFQLQKGKYNQIYLSEGRIQCFTGIIQSRNQQIYLATVSDSSEIMKHLKKSVQINGRSSNDFKEQKTENILGIQFNNSFKTVKSAIQYKICLYLQSQTQQLQLIAFQNSGINIIAPSTPAEVLSNKIFVVHQTNDIIVDVFKCSPDQLSIVSSTSLQGQKANSKDLQPVVIPGKSHTFMMRKQQLAFIQIQAQKAYINWMPFNPTEELGVGYLKYDIGNLDYQINNNQIVFKIGGVYATKSTMTLVTKLKYTLYISNSRNELSQRTMCKSLGQTDLNNIMAIENENIQTSNITISVDIQEIASHFQSQEKLYYNLIADMTLKTPFDENEREENYRFIYFQQEIPKQIFSYNEISTKAAVEILVVSIIGFIIISRIFVRNIVPAIGKLNNRVLVSDGQENQGNPVFQISSSPYQSNNTRYENNS